MEVPHPYLEGEGVEVPHPCLEEVVEVVEVEEFHFFLVLVAASEVQ